MLLNHVTFSSLHVPNAVAPGVPVCMPSTSGIAGGSAQRLFAVTLGGCGARSFKEAKQNEGQLHDESRPRPKRIGHNWHANDRLAAGAPCWGSNARSPVRRNVTMVLGADAARLGRATGFVRRNEARDVKVSRIRITNALNCAKKHQYMASCPLARRRLLCMHRGNRPFCRCTSNETPYDVVRPKQRVILPDDAGASMHVAQRRLR